MDSMPMPPDVDRLLANAGWVKALAVRLVADEAAADDLAQETWLRALERPPRAADTARSLRAWLARVVGRFALQRRRHDEAAERRERAVAAAEAQPDVADVVAHAELHRRIVDAVLALDEPYRATLLLRFFEDETPARIAARMGVPPKTVHTRLRRGLERLRARFEVERRPGGELHAWIAFALPPLAPIAAPPLVGRLLAEVLAMGGKLQVAVAVLVFAGLSVVVWREWRGESKGPAPADASREVAGSASTDGASRAPTPSGATRSALASEAPRSTSKADIDEIVFAGTIAVTGRVVDERGKPIEGARAECSLPDVSARIEGVQHVVDEELHAHGFWDAPCDPPRATTDSDVDGRFSIRGLRSGMPYTLAIAADGFRTVTRAVPPSQYGDTTLGAGEVVRLHDIVLSRGGGVRVHVADARGADVGGAALFVGPWPEKYGFLWPNPRMRRGVTDAQGRGLLTLERSGRNWILASSRDEREAVAIDVAFDEAAPPVELRLEEGASLHVRVHDSGGHALAGVRVWVRTSIAEHAATLTREATTDDVGGVDFHGLPDGSRTLYVDAPGGMPALTRETTQSLTIAADTRDAEFTLATCHPPLAVRFVDAVDGTPVRASEMLVVDGEVDGPPSGSGRGGRDTPTRGIASLSADGMHGTVLLSPPIGHPTGDDRMPREQQSERFRLIVDAHDHARTRLGPFDPEKLSATEPLTLALERGRRLRGTVRDGKGAPIPGARLHEIGPGPGRACNMFTWQECSTVRAARCDRDGVYTLGPVAAGAHELVVDATGFVSKVVAVELGESEPAPLDVELERGLTVDGEVHFEADEEPTSFEVVLQRRSAPAPDAGTLTTAPDDDGRFSFPALPPGEYALLALRPPDSGRDWFADAMGLLGTDASPAVPQVVRLTLTGADRSLVLEPWREAKGRRRLDAPVVDKARPGAKRAVILYLDASGLPHHDDVDLVDGRLAVDLPDAKQYLVLLSEDGRALDLVGDATTRPWYVASRVLSADDVKRGVPSLRVPRGTVRVRVTRADGSEIGDGLRLIVGFFVDPGFSVNFPELLMGNDQVVALPSDGRLTLDDLPVGRTWLYVSDANQQGHGEVYVNVVEGATIDAEIAWK
jgi:RNA polymerase sigma-70 factor (ECF subfamily)